MGHREVFISRPPTRVVFSIYLLSKTKFQTYHSLFKKMKSSHIYIDTFYTFVLFDVYSCMLPFFDETGFGHFLGPKNEPVLIAPTGPLGPGWGSKALSCSNPIATTL